MDCKYCGYRMAGGKACNNSPSGKCVGVPDSTNCVYCTRKFVTGGFCGNSPTEKQRHQLAT